MDGGIIVLRNAVTMVTTKTGSKLTSGQRGRSFFALATASPLVLQQVAA